MSIKANGSTPRQIDRQERGAIMSPTQQPPFISDWSDPPAADPPDRGEYRRRALLIWPGLDRQRLRHTQGDPWRIAGLVSGRTSLSMEAILVLLMGPELDAHQAHPGRRANARSPA